MRNDYDVIVVGARIAGATLAAILGDAGASVLLVDQAEFPSPTCSTHFFRGAGMVAVLDRLDILKNILLLGCPTLTHQLTYAAGMPEPIDGPPQDPGELRYCLSVRREVLDYVLIQRAQAGNTVEFAPRTRVTDLFWEQGRVAGVIVRGGVRIRANIVVGADGRHSLIARKVTARVQERAPARRALYYRYVAGFRGVEGKLPDAAEFSLLDDEIAYVFPSDAGMTCVALSVNVETFRWLRRDPAGRFAARLDRHVGIAPRVRAARLDGRLLGSGPEPSYVRVPFGPGWALVGDSGLHQDPWSGLGIDTAGIHATFLADAIIAWLRSGQAQYAPFVRYHQRRDAHALRAFRNTVTLAADLRAMTETRSAMPEHGQVTTRTS